MNDKKPQLISADYLRLNKELHGRNTKYGGKGDAWADRVIGYLVEERANSYLDYGCGKMNLLNEINARRGEWGVTLLNERFPNPKTAGYDPVTAPDTPEPADFVTCNDVLEHIEPHLLDNVLADIASKIKLRGLLVISQRLANKRLADGRNAHLIVEDTRWWIKRLRVYFREIIEVEPIKPKRVGVELAVLVKPWPEHSVSLGSEADIRLIKR